MTATKIADRPNGFPVLCGRWLGQMPPGEAPVVFAPEVLSSGRFTLCSVFSPEGDEFYVCLRRTDEDVHDIVCMRRIDDIWAPPEPVSFAAPNMDCDLCMSADGSEIFFISFRPLPGAKEPNRVIWRTARTPGGWSDLVPLECAGEVQRAGYPGISRAGALFFSKRVDEESCGVFRADRVDGTYTEPQLVLGGMKRGGDLCVAPDESYLVASCWDLGESDLYASFRNTDGSWSELRNLGAPINGPLVENCPMISHDGAYLFYLVHDRAADTSETRWVSTQAIERKRHDPSDDSGPEHRGP